MSRLSCRPDRHGAHGESVADDPEAGSQRDRQAFQLAAAVFANLAQTARQSADNAPPAGPSTGRQPSLLLELAACNLRILWADSVTVGWDDPAMGPYVLFGDGSVTSVDDLDAERLADLIIAVQLSLVRCLVQRVGHLPLVLTDRSFQGDPRHATRHARLLGEQAAHGQQVLVVTARAAIVQQFHRLQVPTLTVTRQTHDATGVPAPGPDLRPTIP
jgi:hypothetical protein